MLLFHREFFKLKEGENTVRYLSLDEEILAVGADKRLGEEGRKVDHDLSEQRADGSQRRLQLLGQLRLPATAVLVKKGMVRSQS